MDQPTREAAHKGDLAFFQALGDSLRPTAKDEDGRSLLHVACTSGNVALVRFVAEKGGAACVNDQDDEVRSEWRLRMQTGRPCLHQDLTVLADARTGVDAPHVCSELRAQGHSRVPSH